MCVCERERETKRDNEREKLRERQRERERDWERTENRELSQIDIERFWNLIFKRAQSLAEIGGCRRLDSKFRRKRIFRNQPKKIGAVGRWLDKMPRFGKLFKPPNPFDFPLLLPDGEKSGVSTIPADPPPTRFLLLCANLLNSHRLKLVQRCL